MPSIRPDTVDRLARAVQAADRAVDPVTVADAIWLLSCLDLPDLVDEAEEAPPGPAEMEQPRPFPPSAPGIQGARRPGGLDGAVDPDPAPTVPVIDRALAEPPAAEPRVPEPARASPPAAGPAGPGDAGDEARGAAAAEPVAAPGARPGVDTMAASVVRLPTPAALPEPLAVARAFRPFRRRVPAERGTVLDVEETVRASAAARRLVARVRPRRDRWLSLEILVDASPSMAIWDETFTELADAARYSGAFAEVTRHYLHLDGDGITLTDRWWSDDGARLPVPSRRGWRGRAGRTLVLIGSDAVDDRWRREPARKAVRDLGLQAPVALVNPLPVKLWRHTAFGGDATRLNPPAGAVANRHYAVNPTPLMLSDEVDLAGRFALPVLELADGPIVRWARAVANGDPDGVVGIALDPASGTGSSSGPATNPGPEAAVQVFHRLASPRAWRLGVLAATSPTTSLAVIRAIQQHAVPDATLQDLAELLVSGLLAPSPGHGRDTVAFEPGCREALIDAGRHSVDDAFVAYRAVTTALAARLGQGRRAVEAMCADPGGDHEIPADAAPFAEFGRAALGMAGPVAIRLPPPDDPLPTDSDDDTRAPTEPGRSFAGMDLSGERFTGDLRGADFSGARLDRAEFAGADLRGASLGQASMRGTRMVPTTTAPLWLGGADVTGADLTGAVVVPDPAETASLARTIADAARTDGLSVVIPTRPPGLADGVWFDPAGAHPEQTVPASVPRCVAYHPFRDLSAVGAVDGSVRVWDPVTGDTTRTLTGHT
ncbi:MAG: SAV_2336 N-terminal domain-related protein, partial [Acidimicrobiales bacterium]